MIRRRGPLHRRPIRRLARALGILEPRPRQLLNQAHSLEASGKYNEAAQLFARLSDETAKRGMNDRAGNLSLQAARCYANDGDGQTALARARNGLRLLTQAGREHRASVALTQAIDGLRARDFGAEADALQKEFANLLQEAETPAEAEPAPRRLPPKCVNCGGPIRADDVDWIDDATAECPYCGSPVRAVE